MGMVDGIRVQKNKTYDVQLGSRVVKATVTRITGNSIEWERVGPFMGEILEYSDDYREFRNRLLGAREVEKDLPECWI